MEKYFATKIGQKYGLKLVKKIGKCRNVGLI